MHICCLRPGPSRPVGRLELVWLARLHPTAGKSAGHQLILPADVGKSVVSWLTRPTDELLVVKSCRLTALLILLLLLLKNRLLT